MRLPSTVNEGRSILKIINTSTDQFGTMQDNFASSPPQASHSTGINIMEWTYKRTTKWIQFIGMHDEAG